ncbi:MAG TPA: NAD(P)H-dependent oxidoreductase subunit E [Anaerolineales bacterium]|nr:NAD(P)H-dependent oxidoreductase subunit E [Anaerolineales bacterium]
MADRPSPDLTPLQPILANYAGQGRSALIPVLLEAQRACGYLAEPVVEAIGQNLRVPLAEIHGVIEFYTMLYPQPVGRNFVRVCTSPICAALGSEAALEAAARHLKVRPGAVTSDGEWSVEGVECLGLCDMAPAALVGDTPVAHAESSQAAAWIGAPSAAPLGRIAGEPRWLSGRCGAIEPTDVRAFVAHGGFRGLQRTLKELTPAQVVAEIKGSGLVGRGGAAFPTGTKWEMTAAAPGEVRYVVCNADESEPGTFKDRVLLEGDPLSVIEGMAVAAYAVGARRGYLYVRGEYPRAQSILTRALEAARAEGFLGERIQGTAFSFDIELRSGAGAYICGEETSLFESIEGKRGFPRLKPPFPTTHGLFGAPTVINNVETLCTGAWILANGVEAYRSVGTKDSPGSKLFCVSGDTAAPGVYEVPFGTTLGALLSLAGGPRGEVRAILLGGAAGAFVGPDQMDLPLSFEDLKAAGLPLGSGVVAVFNTSRDLRGVLLSLAHFFAHESCGKCFPCQLGTQRQLELMKKVHEGRATRADVAALDDVGFTMTNASLCGLGTTAASAILSARRLWPELLVDGRSA